MPSPKYITEPTQQQLNIRQAYIDSGNEKRLAMRAIMKSTHPECVRFQRAVNVHVGTLKALKECKFPCRVFVHKKWGKEATGHK